MRIRRLFAWLFIAIAVLFVYAAAATLFLPLFFLAVIAVLVSIPLHAPRVGEKFVPIRAEKPVVEIEADADIMMYDDKTGEVFTRMTPEQRKRVQDGMRFE